MANKYYPTIGLEVHAELSTNTKMFCACKNNPDEERPNVNICPICMAHPGALPVINKRAVENVIKVGLALGGNIADFTEFDRKNYFYPDIPKGYQISQYKFPIVSGGHLAGFDITRVHLEEDTANNKHRDSSDVGRPDSGRPT
ncbi:MAG TPA: Asp-tRNA(Asn)/Glu-tRNA(Gln) amidotransferase subunit GatB, partial [Candidatus Paceibacterota bacterium]